MSTKKIESNLYHKIRCKLAAMAIQLNDKELKLEKGFTCWEMPTTNVVRAVHHDAAKLAEIRNAFIVSFEAEGYVFVDKFYWLLEQDGKFIYIRIEKVYKPHGSDSRFEVDPCVYDVRQEL